MSVGCNVLFYSTEHDINQVWKICFNINVILYVFIVLKIRELRAVACNIRLLRKKVKYLLIFQ